MCSRASSTHQIMEKYFDFKLNIFVATLLITVSASGQNYVKTDVWLDSAHTVKTTEYRYFDGLGREAETATNALGTTGTYVHTVLTYDSNGRPKQKWLPVVGLMTPDKLTSSTLTTFCQSTYQDPHAYFENHYNALDETVAVDEAGADWHAAGKQTVTDYDTNVYGEVKALTGDGSHDHFLSE